MNRKKRLNGKTIAEIFEANGIKTIETGIDGLNCFDINILDVVLKPKGETMSTYYTLPIEDGRITTGREFLKRCLRVIGYDECAPSVDKVNEDYKGRIDAAKEQHKELLNTSPEEYELNTLNQIRQLRSFITSDIYEINDKIEIYSDILKEVIDWKPSSKELEQVKKFARVQLEKEISRLKTNLEEINNYSNSKLDYSYSEKLSIIEKKIDDLIAEWDNKLIEAKANERILEEFNRSFDDV